MFAEIAVSDLKTKYPLSPRKFWKKMLEKVILFVITSIIWGAVIFFTLSLIFGFPENTKGLIILASVSYVVGFIAQYLIYAWYVNWYIKTYHYDDETDFLTIRKGVFMPAEIHVQYLKMQDVYVDQDILDRILGIYDVHISSATYSSGIASHIDGVDKKASVELKNLFLEKIKSASNGFKGSVNNNIASDNSPSSVSNAGSVKFSSAISSEAYGLSQDWWISEFAKISLGSIFFPLIISLWIFPNVMKISGTNNFFWLWLALVVCFYLFRMGYLFLWKLHYKYEFGQEYIYIKEGVLSVAEKNMAYSTVQDVRIHQGIIDRIFGVADLVIENASANQSFNFGSHNQKNPLGINGIVIEGLSLIDAKKITEELKSVLIKKVTINKGL